MQFIFFGMRRIPSSVQHIRLQGYLYNYRFRMQRLCRISLIPAFIIFRTKNKFSRLCPGNSTGTHHTGLYGDIQCTFVQVLSAKHIGRSSNNLHFGMGCHIIQCFCQVMGTGNDSLLQTTTAPTGTSPRSAALPASINACFMK